MFQEENIHESRGYHIIPRSTWRAAHPYRRSNRQSCVVSRSPPVGCIVNPNVPDDAAEEIQQRFAWLTPREREVLTLLVDGKTNKDAAEALRLSRRTVETHRGNILEKLRVRSNDELRALCVRHWLPQAM